MGKLDDSEDGTFDPAETDPLGIEAQRIAEAHSKGKTYNAKHDFDALSVKNDEAKKPTRNGYDPYDTQPK